MLKATASNLRAAATRIALWTIGLCPIVGIALVLWLWLESHVPRWLYWQVELVCLLAAELIYAIAVAAALIGTVIMACLFTRNRRAGLKRARVARGLLLSSSVLLAAVVAEAIAAGWQHRPRAERPLPVGDTAPKKPAPPAIRFRSPVADFALTALFPDPAGDRQIDVVVLGESSALGVPYSNWLSIGSMITWKLAEAFPGRPVRARVLARSGDTLEWQHRELTNLPRRPELLIIYCGHNEFTSRLGGSLDLDYYADAHAPAPWQTIVTRLESLSSVCGLIQETAAKCRVAIPPAADRRDLIDVPLYTSAEYATLLVDFKRRLETVVAYAKRIGALPVLILPAANDAAFEPSRSFLPAATTRKDREAFRRDFLAARSLAINNPAAAIERYRALLEAQPGFAETHYRLARLLEQRAQWDQALRHDILARDCDGYPMRMLSLFQEAYRDVAARHGCILIDSQSYFHKIGRHGLLGDDLFQDAMHPSLRGQIALAQAVLKALHGRGAFGWRRDSPAPLIDPETCARRFGLNAAGWRTVCLWGINFNTLAAPLTYDPGRRLHARETYAHAADQIAAGVAPEAVGLPNIGVPALVP